ncbi:MAG: SDR family NAD(P)-dependent oxidoreductase [Saprospiraceae bacterium]
MKNLTGKVVAITGAGSGIGRELALQLAKQGVSLALNDFKAETLAETIQLIDNQKITISSHVFDVSDKPAMYAFAENAIATHGQVDMIINNAGFALSPIPIADLTDDEIRHVLDVNLWGVIHGTKAFLPHLLKRPAATVVNISSVFGMIGVMGQAPYVMSKFAVRGFTESLRMELYDTNVQVTQVHPGGIKTNIVKNGRFRDGQDQGTAASRFENNAPTTAADAATTIIKGIQKKKNRVLIGKDARQIDIAQRLYPTNYVKSIRKIFLKMGLNKL